MSNSTVDQVSPSQAAHTSDSLGEDASIEPRKRKRRTIACIQCRKIKRRCIATSEDKCDGCIQDQVECRRPETDGRKLRWERQRSETKGASNGVPVSGNSTLALQPEGHPADLPPESSSPADAIYLDSLFDLIMGSGQSASSIAGQTPSTSMVGQSSMIPVDGSEQVQVPLGSMPDIDWSTMSNFASPLEGLGPGGGRAESPRGQVRKMIWWRPHGPSAIAPGLQRITLKVRLERDGTDAANSFPQTHTSPGVMSDLVDADGMPRSDIMLHLLDVFMTYFGCLFPALERKQLEDDMRTRSGSTLLFNCIACTASRFSPHPAIALPHLQPHSYGTIFLKTAKNLLGNMLAVPTRDTVLALVLLAGISHGINSESEEWMFAGMAARMAIDLGLHLADNTSKLSANEQRLNRLTFWSVYFVDISLSFGVGRHTAFTLSEVTQLVPSEDDFLGEDTTSHAFIHAAELALAYGPMVNILNGSHQKHPNWKAELTRIIQASVEIYNSLPPVMQWSALNLQTMSTTHQGAIFVQMHLWMHTMLASDYLNDIQTHPHGPPTGTMTPSGATATRLWQNSARTIGDILMLSSLVDPFAYHALPFSNQPLFVAGSCYIKEAEDQERQAALKAAGGTDAADANSTSIRKAGMYVALLKSVTANNIAALRAGLLRQSKYWSGVAWVAGVLSQRWAGVRSEEIDLQTVTDGLDSSISVPDARLFGRPDNEQEWDQGGIIIPQVGDWLADTELLQSAGYDITTDNFTSDWAFSYGK